MSVTYTSRPVAWIVGPSDEPSFSERMTRVEIDDEAGGEFVVVSQCTDQNGDQRIAIDVSEWPALRAAIDAAIAECRDFGEPT